MKTAILITASVLCGITLRGDDDKADDYVTARCAGLPYTAVYVFTQHYQCTACLVSDAKTTAPLVRSHWHVEMIDCDDDKRMAYAFGITVYPTFVAMLDGKEVGRVEGAVSPQEVAVLFKLPSRTQSQPQTRRRRR